MRLSTTIALAVCYVLAATTTTDAKPFGSLSRSSITGKPRGIHNNNNQSPLLLELRGGGDFFPTTVAKLYTRVALAKGLYAIWKPERVNQKLGLSHSNLPLDNWMTASMGHMMTSIFVLYHNLLKRKPTDLPHAVAYSLINWIVLNTKSIRGDSVTKLGVDTDGIYINWALQLAIVVSVVRGWEPWATRLIQVHSIAWTVQSILCVLTPKWTISALGETVPWDDTTVVQQQMFGAATLAYHTTILLLLYTGFTAVEAVGIMAFIVAVCALLSTMELPKIDVAKEPVYWMAAGQAILGYIMAGSKVTGLISSGSGSPTTPTTPAS